LISKEEEEQEEDQEEFMDQTEMQREERVRGREELGWGAGGGSVHEFME
jgi:hypothetical protein